MNKFVHFLKASIYDPLVNSFFRFTETLALSVIIVIMTIVKNEWHLQASLDPVLRTLWLLLPIFVLITLVTERFRLRPWWRYGLMVAAVGAMVGYYFYIRFEPSNFVDMLRYFSILGMTAFLALCVPYFPHRGQFSIFIMYLASKMFATMFYTGVLYGSLVAIFASIEALFSANLGNYIYINMFVIVVGFAAIPIFLGFMPKQDTELTIADYNKIWKTVFSFIVLPVVIVFSLILLVYLVTSTINQNYYPDVFLIATVGVGCAGIATLVALDPFVEDTTHIQFFSRYWPYLMTAITIGYFVKTIRLIIADGFNAGNAAYMYLGIWLLALLIIRIFKKDIFGIGFGQTFFLISVDTLFLISMMPFINVVNIAYYQYNHELRVVLEKYDMLQDGQIVPRTDLTNQEQNEILAVINEAVTIGLERLDYLPDGFTLSQFETVFGFEYNYYVADEHIEVSWGIEGDTVDINALPAHDYLYLLGHLPEDVVTLGDLTISRVFDTNSDYTFDHTDFMLTISLYDVAVHLYETLPLTYGDFDLASLTYESGTAMLNYALYIRHFAGSLNITTQSFTLYNCSAVLGIDIV